MDGMTEVPIGRDLRVIQARIRRGEAELGRAVANTAARIRALERASHLKAQRGRPRSPGAAAVSTDTRRRDSHE
jgi:hypothetical protein